MPAATALGGTLALRGAAGLVAGALATRAVLAQVPRGSRALATLAAVTRLPALALAIATLAAIAPFAPFALLLGDDAAPVTRTAATAPGSLPLLGASLATAATAVLLALATRAPAAPATLRLAATLLATLLLLGLALHVVTATARPPALARRALLGLGHAALARQPLGRLAGDLDRLAAATALGATLLALDRRRGLALAALL